MIIKTKSTFLLVKYSLPTKLIRTELLELDLEFMFRIKSLNVKFFKYQKQSPGVTC